MTKVFFLYLASSITSKMIYTYKSTCHELLALPHFEFFLHFNISIHLAAIQMVVMIHEYKMMMRISKPIKEKRNTICVHNICCPGDILEFFAEKIEVDFQSQHDAHQMKMRITIPAFLKLSYE